jgi:hypothetical protein
MYIILILVFCTIFIVIVLSQYKEDFTNITNNNINNISDDDVIILTYENESYESTKSNNLIRMLKKLGYPYVNIVGQNEIWNGWTGRTNAYRNFMDSIPNKNAYICVCDGRDVLPNTSYDNLKKVISESYNGKIIFGSETYCCTGFLETDAELKSQHLERMKEIKKSKSDTKTDAYFLNYGLAFGKIKDFIRLFENLDVNKKDFDDQAEVALLFQNNDEVELDYDEKLGCNIAGIEDTNLAYSMWPYLLIADRRNATPCFFHFPGKNAKYESALELLSLNNT